MNLHLRLTAATAAVIIMTSAMQAQEKRFYASVYSTNEWKEYVYSETGLYSFSLDTYDRQLVSENSELDASGGGTMTEDFYFCTSEINYGSWTEVNHYTFNPDTWQLNSQIFGYQQGAATDLAYDHTTARIYGCFSTDPEAGEPEGKFVFGTLNEATGERLAIKKIDTPWIALGCNRGGQLYAVDMGGTLWKVDKINGNTEKIADLGVTANRRSTGAIDTATGIFYVVFTNEDDSTIEEYGYSMTKSELYAVDVTAGTARRVYEFADGEGLGGMYIPGPLADDNAPAEATGMTLTFADGDLNGKISFTMPDKTFGGATLSVTSSAPTARSSPRGVPLRVPELRPMARSIPTANMNSCSNSPTKPDAARNQRPRSGSATTLPCASPRPHSHMPTEHSPSHGHTPLQPNMAATWIPHSLPTTLRASPTM